MKTNNTKGFDMIPEEIEQIITTNIARHYLPISLIIKIHNDIETKIHLMVLSNETERARQLHDWYYNPENNQKILDKINTILNQS